MKDAIITTPEYRQFISELKPRVLSARISASCAVNRDVIFLDYSDPKFLGQVVPERSGK